MKTRFFSYFFLLFCLNVTVESCLISIKPKLDRPNIKYKDIPRKVYTIPKQETEKCVCGMETSYRYKEWNIYIQVKLPNSSYTQPCVGVVIAHNLVVTSHHCLSMERNAVRPYDVWQVAPKHRVKKMANASDLKMTIKILRNFTDTGTNTLNVNATKVIYNPAHSGFAGVEVASANDIALIVTKDDLFKQFEFDNFFNATNKTTELLRTPICLPAVDERRHVLESTLHKFGYYYGYDAGYPTILPLKMKVANEIRVLDGSDCDKEAGFDKFSTPGSLCIRTPVGLPTREGGPLIVTDGLGPVEMPHEYAGDFNLLTHIQTAYLLGINTVAEKRVPGKRLTYSYFANVLQNLEFIETTAKNEGSEWCDTPPFPHTASEQTWEEWPWETNPAKPRSKTLDCACGFSNSKKEAVIGGSNAEPYEFGWMARFTFTYRPNNKDFKPNISYYCGASVINDRVLLTAGHCLIQPKNELVLLDEVPFPIIEEYKLFIGLHDGDERNNSDHAKSVRVAEFMIHPGFIPHQKSFISSDDVVVMILADPLKFSTAKTKDQVKQYDIRPICLPEISNKVELKAETKLTAVGWGILHENKTDSSGKQIPVPDVLQKIQITVQSMKHCRGATEALIPDTVFCVENFRKDYSTTEGDSGGPVSYLKPNGQHFQVGLISFGIRPSKLDFFVDVHNYLPFIEYYSAMEGAQWCKH